MIPPTLDVPRLQRNANNAKPIVPLETLVKACEGNEELVTLLGQVKDTALHYAATVCEMAQIDVKGGAGTEECAEREAISKARRRVHDSFYDLVNILSRNLRKAGRDNSWRDALADDRARFGKLAITLSFEICKLELAEKERIA